MDRAEQESAGGWQLEKFHCRIGIAEEREFRSTRLTYETFFCLRMCARGLLIGGCVTTPKKHIPTDAELFKKADKTGDGRVSKAREYTR